MADTLRSCFKSLFVEQKQNNIKSFCPGTESQWLNQSRNKFCDKNRNPNCPLFSHLAQIDAIIYLVKEEEETPENAQFLQKYFLNSNFCKFMFGYVVRFKFWSTSNYNVKLINPFQWENKWWTESYSWTRYWKWQNSNKY